MFCADHHAKIEDASKTFNVWGDIAGGTKVACCAKCLEELKDDSMTNQCVRIFLIVLNLVIMMVIVLGFTVYYRFSD